MENKMIGYLLVVAGVIIILITAFSVYSVFTKKIEPINIVNSESLFMPSGVDKGSPVGMMNIDMDSVSYIANLSFTLVLGGFFLNVGFKLASLGAMLARPIRVDLKNESGRPQSS